MKFCIFNLLLSQLGYIQQLTIESVEASILASVITVIHVNYFLFFSFLL
jgi:hypothetical protein